MHNRGLCRHAVTARPFVSVCPSVTFAYSVKTNKGIFNSLSGSHTIHFFRTKPYGNIPTGPPYRGRRMEVE